MPRYRGARSRYRKHNIDHGYHERHHVHHGVDKRHARAKRCRANINSSALRRMVLNTTSSCSNQENLVIISTYYRRFDDGSSYHDGHSFWSYQRRVQMTNSCFTKGKGRFGLGVHTKRFLAITELADEFMVPREERGNWGAILPDMMEHSIINEEIFYSDEEDFEL